MANFLKSFFRSSKVAAPSKEPVMTVWPVGGASSAMSGSDARCALPLAVATVFRCVRLLSDMVSVMPLRLQERQGNLWADADRFRLPYLLEIQPNESQNCCDLWKEAISQLLINGNAFILPQRGDYSEDYDRLILLSPGSCTFDELRRVYDVNDPITGIMDTFTESELIHIKGPNFRGQRMGVGVISFARQTLATAESGNAETYERFVSGGHVRGFLCDEVGVAGYGQTQTDELNRAARQIDYKFRNNERIVRLPFRSTFKELTLSSADMQFLESRKFTVREICRFFGVHPSFVFDDTSNNYKSAEMANVAFLSQTLNPLLKQIEAEFRRKLFTEQEAMLYRFQFDRDALNACDRDSEMAWRKARIETGLDTINEARQRDGREPVEGGDRVLVSANLKSLEALVTEGADKNDNNNAE